MAQAAFEFSPCHEAAPAAAPANSLEATGFAIGWDHAHHRVTPPLHHLSSANPVAQGWAAGRAAFGQRQLRATAAVRQWLALRLLAWQQGAVFEDQQVNPSFLARIDVDLCPVRRQPLMLGLPHAGQLPDDAAVLRLNTAAAYAAGNLAVVSHQVAAACAGGLPSTQPAGLDSAAWQRLQVLASFATPLAHAQAALLPLCVLPPNRVRVINPVQALQVMLTLQFSSAGYARRLLALAALVPSSDARQAFQIFMHTLLARRLSAGVAPAPLQLRQAMEDSWADALVQRRWQRLAQRLTAADCELWLQRAHQRGLVVGGGRWLSTDAAVDGWALAPAVCLGGAAAAAVQPGLAAALSATAPAGIGGAVPARPSKARNRGSQKAANWAGLTACGSRQ